MYIYKILTNYYHFLAKNIIIQYQEPANKQLTYQTHLQQLYNLFMNNTLYH